MDVNNNQWQLNIKARNSDVLNNKTTDYFVDEGLLNKSKSSFEEPDKSEIDIRITI